MPGFCLVSGLVITEKTVHWRPVPEVVVAAAMPLAAAMPVMYIKQRYAGKNICGGGQCKPGIDD